MDKKNIGIDEVGRGALAGPVSIGAFCVFKDKEKSFKDKIDSFHITLHDSKKLSKKQREEWYAFLCELQKEKLCDFCVAHVSSKTIDKEGIVFALNKGIFLSLLKLSPEKDSTILLDGSLYAPKEYTDQKTIIKGDETEYVISCASIVAKVIRDRFMNKQSLIYKEYGFEKHVGYGTKAHYEVIHKHGPTPIHRKTFLHI